MTIRRNSWVMISALALLGGSSGHTAINDMHMFSGGGGGLGSSGPCLDDPDIVRLAKALRDIERNLGDWRQAVCPPLRAAARATVADECATACTAVDDFSTRLQLYRGLLPDDAIVRPKLSHRVVYNDRLARELRRDDGANSFENEFRRLTQAIGACDADAQVAALESPEISSALMLLADIPNGASITLPYEPYLPSAGTPVLALNFNYWPFDHVHGRSLAAKDDLRSARVDVSFAYSVTDWLRFGVRAPFTLIADTPRGTTPERGTGLGDLTLMAQAWWTEPLTRDGRMPLDSLFSILHLGSAIRLSLPVGSEAGELSHGNSVAHLDFLKAAVQLGPPVLPRFHWLVGRIVEIESDDDDADDSPSRYPGGWEFAAGGIWNLDSWRRAGNPDWNLAWWGDVAGMYHDRAMGPPGDATTRAIELRGGIGYLRQHGGRGASDRTTRTMLSLEVARRLDDGLRSGMSWQVGLSVSR